VDRALERLLGRCEVVSVESLADEIMSEEHGRHAPRREALIIPPVDLSMYDRLLTVREQEVVSA